MNDFARSDARARIEADELLIRLGLARQQASGVTPLTGTILLDPQNVTGVASTTGRSVATYQGLTGPVFSKYANIVTRWGGFFPILNAATTVAATSSHTDDSDPVVFTPIGANGAPIVLRGTTIPVVTGGTAAGTVAQNRATGQLLNSGVGAGPAINQLWIDKTAGACAWSNSLVAGSTFSLSRPLTLQSPGDGTIPPLLTTVNGDTIDVVSLTAINVARFAPLGSSFGSGVLPSLYRCVVFSPDGVGADLCDVGMNVGLQECSFQRVLCYNGDSGLDTFTYNCNLQGGFNGGATSQASYFVVGGILGAASGGAVNTTVQNVVLDGDIILNETVFLTGTGSGGAQIGLVSIGATFLIHCYGYAQLTSLYNGGLPVVWGAGTFDSCGRVIYNSNQNAVSTFLNAGGLQMNGGTTAFSSNTAQPTVIEGGITLTPAHLDAAQGVAGFGGKAFNLFSGASLQSAPAY